jgi:hypothetical protein
VNFKLALIILLTWLKYLFFAFSWWMADYLGGIIHQRQMDYMECEITDRFHSMHAHNNTVLSTCLLNDGLFSRNNPWHSLSVIQCMTWHAKRVTLLNWLRYLFFACIRWMMDYLGGIILRDNWTIWNARLQIDSIPWSGKRFNTNIPCWPDWNTNNLPVMMDGALLNRNTVIHQRQMDYCKLLYFSQVKFELIPSQKHLATV